MFCIFLIYFHYLLTLLKNCFYPVFGFISWITKNSEDFKSGNIGLFKFYLDEFSFLVIAIHLISNTKKQIFVDIFPLLLVKVILNIC